MVLMNFALQVAWRNFCGVALGFRMLFLERVCSHVRVMGVLLGRFVSVASCSVGLVVQRKCCEFALPCACVLMQRGGARLVADPDSSFTSPPHRLRSCVPLSIAKRIWGFVSLKGT